MSTPELPQDLPTEADLEALGRLLGRSRQIVAFTGAGISTESGIPDFRSKGGLWERYQPILFQDFLASEEMRRESWRRKLASDHTFARAQPNAGHEALATLFEMGLLRSVVTQNVDNLHQSSGIPPEKVIELHGNATYAGCLRCQRRHELEPILERFRESELLPTCDDCGGIVKTATISFGQPMPVEAMRRAEEETLASDLFLVLGTSLVVYPAAGFPLLAKDNGAALAIVNRDPTEQDGAADLALHTGIGPTLQGAIVRFLV